MINPVSIVRWGIRFEGQDEPYEVYGTEEEAMDAYNGMKLKHQASEEVVRVSSIITVVKTSDAASEEYWRLMAE